MPRVTQYIREEDVEAWGAIENKSQWIHEHLNQQAMPRAVKQADPALGSKDYCEHGQLKGECLVKGCKYARV